MKKLIMLLVVLCSALSGNSQISYQVYRNGGWQIAQSGTQIAQGETYALYQNGTLIGSSIIATNTFTVAAAGTAPAPSGCTTCPPPTPKCNDCTASNSSKDKKDDEQTKLLKSINQKLTWGLIIGGADLFIDGFHLIWDMTRGEYVASNGTKQQDGNPFSGDGAAQ